MGLKQQQFLLESRVEDLQTAAFLASTTANTDADTGAGVTETTPGGDGTGEEEAIRRQLVSGDETTRSDAICTPVSTLCMRPDVHLHIVHIDRFYCRNRSTPILRCTTKGSILSGGECVP
jgi:hypothetical protein